MHYKNSIMTALTFVCMQLSASGNQGNCASEVAADNNVQEITCNQDAVDPKCSVCGTNCIYWPSEASGVEVEKKEPVDFSRYAFEAEVFAMCAQGSKNDEQRHTCEELANTIRFMKRLGLQQHVKAKELINGISKLTEKQRVLALRKLIHEAGTLLAIVGWKNGRIAAYQAMHNASTRRVESVYFDTFLQHMANNDPQTYFTLKGMLKKRVRYLDPSKPLSVCKSAFLSRNDY
jgi:hypothetical protein